MKCPKCSTDNPDTQRFCGGCGTSLALGADKDAATQTFQIPVIELTMGSTFAGRYRIIEELGSGGMGRVYRVLDQTLGEEIAVKFMRPEIATDEETIQRFRVELRAARQVVHKNVARMFDLNEEKGVPYITMEYVQGENLRRLIKQMGRLSPGQAVTIARQVCEGLAEAHRLGVIHRDLKPQNIMIDGEGRVRIMDFGLARMPKVKDQTDAGVVMGTPAYISPEQVEGAPADARSDIYALGIILYEMLTGKAPFTASTPLSLALKHVTSVPRDPREINASIPESLSRVVLKCLEKDRTKRYQSAEAVLSDLSQLEKDIHTGEILRARIKPAWRGFAQRIRARRIPQAALLLAALFLIGYFISHQLLIPPETEWKSSVAVLPVEDQSPQKAQQNLCRGLQEDIIVKLSSSIPELRVIPLPSVSQYDYSGKNSREIGRDLGADYLLKLVLQEEGKRLRVTLNMIDAKGNEIRQPYTYEKDLESYFEIQDEIPRYIARALKANLVESRLRTIKMREPSSLVAYYNYLEASRLIEDVYPKSRRPEDFAEAVRRYEKAIELDPNYALAYWGLGNAYEARYYSSDRDSGDLERMKSCYMEAHERNPDLAETNLGLGWLYFNITDNVRASQHFKRALELDPENFIVNNDAGAFLNSVGLHERALKYFQRALKIDPLSLSVRILISACRMDLGDFEDAAREIELVIEKEPRNIHARYYYALELIMMDRLDDAEKEIETTIKITPQDPDFISKPRALLWAARGEREKALAFIQQKEVLNIAGTYLYVLLGMIDEAIRNIEAGIERGFEVQGEYLYSYPSLAHNPIFKTLRNEPRFRGILRREKLKYQEKLRKFARL